jgi:hypothetical protein
MYIPKTNFFIFKVVINNTRWVMKMMTVKSKTKEGVRTRKEIKEFNGGERHVYSKHNEVELAR